MPTGWSIAAWPCGSGSRDSKPKAAAAAPTGPQSRTVAKPAPRLFRPAPPLVGVTGVKPNHRHHGDGLYENGRPALPLPR